MTEASDRVAWHQRAAMIIAMLIVPLAVAAGTVTIDNTAGEIAIEANSATIDEVLTRIGEHQGFEVERLGLAPSVAMSGRFSGTTGEVVSRILQHESHMIVHSATAQAGIARIILFGATETNPAAPAATPAAAVPAAIPADAPVPPIPVVAPEQPTVKRARG